MALLRGPAPALGRSVRHLLSVVVPASLVTLVLACGGGVKGPAPTVGERPVETSPAGTTVVTVYSSPTCGCCGAYEKYLAQEGFQVEAVKTEDMTGIKDSLGVPQEVRSCHTAIVDNYFVEGHVPVEAIQKLLQERPAIEGIALPGMPAGSPGMGGAKTQPFVIYSVAEGKVAEFTRI